MASKRATRKSLWIAGFAVLVCVGALIFLARDPYSFLDKYNPHRFEVDMSKQIPKATLRPSSISRMTLLVFSMKDADRILADLKARYNPRTGYDAIDEVAALQDFGITPYRDELEWRFVSNPKRLPPDRVEGNEEIRFLAGSMGGDQMHLLMQGWDHWDTSKHERACVVVITTKPTWFDRVRTFLHL